MNHGTRGITKWRQRAIFTDLTKTKITFYPEEKDSPTHRKIPKDLRERPLQEKPLKKATGRKPSIMESTSILGVMLCFVVFVYFKMLQLETQNQQTVAQIETLSALSVFIGILFLITFATSLIFGRFFPSES